MAQEVIFSLAVHVLILIILGSLYVSQKTLKHYIMMIGGVYFFRIILDIYWLMKLASSSGYDVIVINSGFIVIETVLILLIFSTLTRKKYLFLLLPLYLISVLSMQFVKFFYALGLISYLLLMLCFISLAGKHRTSSLYGFLAAGFLFMHSILELKFPISWWFLYLLGQIFLGFLYYSLTKAKAPLIIDTNTHNVLTWIKTGISVIATLGIVVLAVVSVHELGHAISGSALGCTNVKAVIYSEGIAPHTELRCDEGISIYVVLAGFGLPCILGLLLLLFGERFLSGISYLVIAFSLFFAGHDFGRIGITNNFIIIGMLTMYLFLFLGIWYTSEFYYKELVH